MDMATQANSNIINKDEELTLTKKSWRFVKTYGRILGKYAFKFTKKAVIKAPKVVFKFTKRLVLKRKCCKTNQKNIKFSNFVIEVSTDKPGWYNALRKVLASVEGYGREAEVDGDKGLVRVSSTLDPDTLLKNLRKVDSKAKLRKWKYGDCSSNFHGVTFPENKPKEAPSNQNANTIGNQIGNTIGNKSVPLSQGLQPANKQVSAGAHNGNPFHDTHGQAMPYNHHGHHHGAHYARPYNPHEEHYGHGAHHGHGYGHHGHGYGHGAHHGGPLNDGYGHGRPYGGSFNGGYRHEPHYSHGGYHGVPIDEGYGYEPYMDPMYGTHHQLSY